MPQCQSFNGGWWKRAENRVRRYAQHYCTQGQQPGTLYVLTGTSFSPFDPDDFPQANDFQIQWLEFPWIRIPASMWIAGCCVRGPNAAESFAVIGNNLQNHQAGEDRSLTQQVTVVSLQTFLGNDAAHNHFINGEPNVRLFRGNPNCLINAPNLNILHLPLPH